MRVSLSACTQQCSWSKSRAHQPASVCQTSKVLPQDWGKCECVSRGLYGMSPWVMPLHRLEPPGQQNRLAPAPPEPHQSQISIKKESLRNPGRLRTTNARDPKAPAFPLTWELSSSPSWADSQASPTQERNQGTLDSNDHPVHHLEHSVLKRHRNRKLFHVHKVAMSSSQPGQVFPQLPSPLSRGGKGSYDLARITK